MATPLAIATIALGAALQVNNGAYAPGALLLVTVAFLALAMVVTSGSAAWIERWGERPAILVIGSGLVYQFGLILTSPAGVYIREASSGYEFHHAAVAAAAVLAGAGLSRRPWLNGFRWPIVLTIYFALGLWLIRASPNPRIDVYAWHDESFRLLSAHANPYAATMPNIYGFTGWYAEGLATATRVSVGFPYPPLSLGLAWVGHQFGDYRYALLVAVTLSAAFMAYARPGRLGASAAALFLFTPRGLFVLEQGWTEPLVVLLLSATVFCACRTPRLLHWALGLLIAIKQYSVLILPLAPFLLGRRYLHKSTVQLLLGAGLFAAVLTVPVALWNARAFVSSVVLFQGKQPFRGDALSYLAWSAQDGVSRLPLWTSFAALLGALLIALWRAPRTPAGFAAASAFVFLAFFAFAKQAFCNYYFMIIGALCCAIAAIYPARTSTP